MDEIRPVEEESKTIGKSWFEREEELRVKTGHQGITRVVFIALVCDDSFGSDNVAAEKLFGKAGESTVGGGLILLSSDREAMVPSSTIGFIEVQGESFMDNLIKLTSFGMHTIRILLYAEDCPTRDFAEPFSLYSASPPKGEAENMDDEPTHFFQDLMAIIRKYSSSFADSDTLSHCKHLKLLNGENRKALPSANKIVRIAQSDIYPSLEEFVSIFQAPMGSLESEKASPLLPVVDWKEVKGIVNEAFQN
jgi:hypothetical protein